MAWTTPGPTAVDYSRVVLLTSRIRDTDDHVLNAADEWLTNQQACAG
ncbi:MAG: hypothetical protein ACLFRT_07350 [Actinomycetota bacterium]